MLISGEMWESDDEKTDSRQTGRQGHEEWPFLDSADKREKDDEEDLTDFVSRINPEEKKIIIKKLFLK